MLESAEMMREKTFNIRLNDEEWARLDRVATARGINAASVIRMLLKEADDRILREADLEALLAAPNTDALRRFEDTTARIAGLKLLEEAKEKRRAKTKTTK